MVDDGIVLEERPLEPPKPVKLPKLNPVLNAGATDDPPNKKGCGGLGGSDGVVVEPLKPGPAEGVVAEPPKFGSVEEGVGVDDTVTTSL